LKNPLIFCEPFCGSAAVTYRLLGGPHSKPPTSYLGAKTGYAGAILEALGLRAGQGADGLVLCDPGPWAAVHATLGGAEGSAGDAARWLLCGEWAHRRGEPGSGYAASRVTDARYPITSNLTPGKLAAKIGSGAVADQIAAWEGQEPRALWERLRREGWPSLLLPPGHQGRWLGPQPIEEVLDKRIRSVPAFPPLACYQGSAADLALPADLTGWIIYADPPYQGTTGYPHGDCDRATVLSLARSWAARGAVVAISEAEPLPLEGWHHLEITGRRVGSKRSFSRQQAEWLTLSCAPDRREVQGALF